MPFKLSTKSEKIFAVLPNTYLPLDRSRSPSAVVDTSPFDALVPAIRLKFSIPADFEDEAIAADLHAISAKADSREKWRTAFNSELGRILAASGRDLNTTLNSVLSLLAGKLS